MTPQGEKYGKMCASLEAVEVEAERLFTPFHFVSKMQLVTSAAPLGRKSGRQK